MCSDIMTLSNSLVYSGRLKCGTPAIASRSLQIPNLPALHPSGTPCNPCWLAHLLDPATKAVFVDTDLLPAPEVRSSDRITNPTEAALLHQLVTALITTGIPSADIGVISVYRSQLKILQRLLSQHSALELHTADKFQGRDKEVVVISLVRSNDNGEVGQLLRDWRRINVAFTRARTKLVVFASAKTLCQNDMLKGFVDLMRENNWVYQLPAGALETHQTLPTSPARSRASGGSGSVKNSPTRVNGRQSLVRQSEFWEDRPVLRDLVNDFA
jgi:DNA replication ATP-dependent helicase Dna2